MYKEAFLRGYHDMLDHLVKQAQIYDDTGRMLQALNDDNSMAYGMQVNKRPGIVKGQFDLSENPEIRREQIKKFKEWNDGRVLDVRNDGARLSWDWTSPHGIGTETAPTAAPAAPAQTAQAQTTPAAPAQTTPAERRSQYRYIPTVQQTKPVVNRAATVRWFNEYNSWQRSVAAQEADRARGVRRVARPPVDNSWIPKNLVV